MLGGGARIARVRAEPASSSIRVTWWGHATVLIDDRARILTDPLLTGALMHLHRRAGLVPHPPPGLDAVAISHLHMDHLHLPSLAQLDPGTPVLIPRGAAGLLAKLPVEPVEVVGRGRGPGRRRDRARGARGARRDPVAVGWRARRGRGLRRAGSRGDVLRRRHLGLRRHGRALPGEARRGPAAGVGLGPEPARGAHGPRAGGRVPARARRRRRHPDPLRDLLAARHGLGAQAGLPRARPGVRRARPHVGPVGRRTRAGGGYVDRGGAADAE